MTAKFVNVSLFVLLIVLTVTGLLTLIFSAGANPLFALHRWAGVALVAVLPWKIGIAWRSLRRRVGQGPGRALAVGVSLPLAGLLILTLSLVLAWTLNWVPIWSFAGYPALLLHWYAGLILLPLLAVHVYAHWYRRPTKGLLNTRRQFLRAGVVGLGSVVAWAGLTVVADALQALNELRRFTGSREVGSFLGNAMPVTALLTDNPAPVDVASWRLTVSDASAQPLVLSQTELADLPQSTLTATLDCTNGWYSTQHWTGVRVSDLLTKAGVFDGAASPTGALVRIRSVTGHQVVLPIGQAQDAILATHISGEPLNHGHGAPLRLAHPGLRGWLWVKWVKSVEILRASQNG